MTVSNPRTLVRVPAACPPPPPPEEEKEEEEEAFPGPS
jgi:hypothetical protein